MIANNDRIHTDNVVRVVDGEMLPTVMFYDVVRTPTVYQQRRGMLAHVLFVARNHNKHKNKTCCTYCSHDATLLA